jgi:hypothetical protein
MEEMQPVDLVVVDERDVLCRPWLICVVDSYSKISAFSFVLEPSQDFDWDSLAAALLNGHKKAKNKPLPLRRLEQDDPETGEDE